MAARVRVPASERDEKGRATVRAMVAAIRYFSRMAIRLAFSNAVCPSWTLDEAIDAGASLGFAAIELRTLGVGGSGLRSDPAFSDPVGMRKLLQSSPVRVACLSTSIPLGEPGKRAMVEHHAAVVGCLERASAMGCPFVRVQPGPLARGRSSDSLLNTLAEQGRSLAPIAAKLGVTLLFENDAAMSAAHPWWRVMNQIDHPAVGMVWNVTTAALAGESPAIWVPALNSRLRIVRLALSGDVNPDPSTSATVLQNDALLEHTMHRLMGIGFDGFAIVEVDRPLDLNTDDSLAPLRKAREKLSQLITTLSQTVTGKPKAKPVAKPVAKAPG